MKRAGSALHPLTAGPPYSTCRGNLRATGCSRGGQDGRLGLQIYTGPFLATAEKPRIISCVTWAEEAGFRSVRITYRPVAHLTEGIAQQNLPVSLISTVFD